MKHAASDRLFAEARVLIPGGVNSPVRAWRAVGRDPLFIQSAAGCTVTDVDGNVFTDYIGSWGPMILGHGHPAVTAAVVEAVAAGTSFGAPSPREPAMARLIADLVPSVEMVRMVSSGTEACMSAVRLARGFTGRDAVVKFEGCYHGHADGLLVKAGSGALTTGVPDSAGVPADYARHTLTARWNDPAGITDLFDARGMDIAAVILEPVAANMGVVPPAPGWLELLRDLTRRHGSLLIFDEVITGFRLAPGGAQEFYGIRPDLSCFGKIIGGGLPVGAYGGRRDIMEKVSPLGPVYQAGTLSGNPVALAAGTATLEWLRGHPEVYPAIAAGAARLEAVFRAATAPGAAAWGLPLTVNRVGSLLSAFFTAGPVTDFAGATRSDTERFARFFGAMLARGQYIAPSQFEALFVSAAHDDAVLDATCTAIQASLTEVAATSRAFR